MSAIFSDDGLAAVIAAEDTFGTKATLQAFGATSNRSIPLPNNSRGFRFVSPTNLRYTVVEDNATVAYEMDWEEGTTKSLWRIPLTDIDTKWTDRGALIINKPAPWLTSGVYSVENGTLTRVVAPEYVLSAKTEMSGRFILYSYFDNELGGSANYILDRETSTVSPSALIAIPDKCTFILENFWCASSFEVSTSNRDVLNDWYRGEFTASDALWQGKADGSAAYVDNLSGLAGFYIDVTQLTGTKDNQLFFINKTNNTLWVYKINE